MKEDDKEDKEEENKPGAGIGPKSGLHGVTLIRSVPLTLMIN